VTAKCAPVGVKEPSESSLDGISGAYASKINGSAMRATCGEHPYSGTNHDVTSTFAALVGAGSARYGDGIA
jgi:hypothetical protein